MRHGSLFSGIGGFDLAAEWMGWENIFHCEWNPFGQKILKHYWPDAISYTDITKTDFSIHRGEIDIITGGFPCQPYSEAGKRKGKEDERHLWPEMFRAIREVQPSWVVGENVPGLLNWNWGVVLDEIKTDLESQGFEVFPPCVLPACGVNAPHRRDRVWIIAYSGSNGHKPGRSSKDRFKTRESESKGLQRQRIRPDDRGTSEQGITSDTTGNRQQGRSNERKLYEPWQRGEQRFEDMGSISTRARAWQNFPTQSPVCNGNDGIPNGLDISSISYNKWRNESIKSGGNAVVPQVVFEIFKTIEQYDKY